MSETAQNLSFSSDIEQRFQKLLTKYEIRDSALLPTLYLAQEQWGYLSEPVMNYVAKRLDLPPRHVYEVVSFYVLFKKKDMGRFCLQVCQNITCTLMGADALVGVIKEELGLKPNEVTQDKLASFMPVQCLGSCDTAPVVQINEDYFENQTPESFRDILRKMKQGQAPVWKEPA